MALPWVSSQPGLPETLQYLMEVVEVIGPGDGVNDDVIQIGRSVLSVGPEDNVH